MNFTADSAKSVLSGILIVALTILVVGVPLGLGAQWVFALLAIAGAMWFAFRNSRKSLLTLGILSLLVSTRYMFWRTTQTLSFQNPAELVLGLGLYLAELYAWVILALGFLQTAWPLERPVVEIGGDPRLWPTIDVYIPTYNEDLSIVRGTVLAAMDMDYPQERFRVFLLDDGRRSEFQAFAREVGCGYLTRADNKHAKAGNLNNALRKTSGELIAIFDCDHVPTRAFLQMTAGWFRKDAKLAMLQTPHYFYSPDPVQRNLRTIEDQPGEGDLFYGPIQKGNDLWNATFFCGSCALIRRTAVMATKGFAGETVTEDAHTALKLQRMGWNTAYIGVRLSAGLATERLALHVGQRIRWARGMTQIMRVDNPLLGRGLTLPQRLCYLNAMLHFQFPLPRIVFLTSPLAYLFFGLNIIQASASLIFAYALPHLYCAMVSGTRVHGPDRRPLWSEIYETLLAFHLVKPTVLTWFNPRKGKFNVTDKGGRLDRSYFDTRIVRPHLICIGLVLAGILIGAIKLLFFPHLFNIQADTFLLNTIWATFSLMILIASVSVARETRQAREHVRISAQLPVTIYFADGFLVDAVSEEISMGGLSATLPSDFFVDSKESKVEFVSMPMGNERLTIPAQMVRLRAGRITIRFRELDIAHERQLVRAVMGRADAWVPDHQRKRVTALRSLWDIAVIDVVTIGRLFRLNRKERAEEIREIREDVEENRLIVEAEPQQKLDGLRRPSRIAKSAAGLAALALLLWTLVPSPASAQEAKPTGQQPSAAAPPAARTPDVFSAEGSGRKVITLADLRVRRPIRLEGSRGEIGIPFGMREDEVVTGAHMTVRMAWSPALLSDLSQLVVLLNDEVVQIIRLSPADSGGQTFTFPINSALFLPGDNRLNLRLVGHYTRDCEDPFHSSLWANVSNLGTALDLSIQKLKFAPDLAKLPRPFFDPNQNRKLRLPFVFPQAPDNGQLEAAASIASWMGSAASYRGFDFTPVYGSIPQGNAVVFLQGGQSLPGINFRSGGASAVVMQNPVDPYGQVLVIMGRDARELNLAAAALASGRSVFRGSSASLGSARIPNFKAYGAPRWLRSERAVQLGELIDPNALQGVGLTPGPLSVQFRTAPDLFFWPRDGGTLDLRYRFPVAPWLDPRASRLDVSMNGQFEKTLPVGNRGWWRGLFGGTQARSTTASGRVTLPRYDLYGQNELVFDYQLVLAEKKRCSGTLPQNVHVSVLPDSTINFSKAYHALEMPNLAVFANAGYPFTIRPDLAETVVLLGPNPSPDEIRAFLILMGRFGDSTGTPTTRVKVIRTFSQSAIEDRDLIVIGGTQMLRQSALFEDAPVSNANGRLTVTHGSAIVRAWNGVWPTASQQELASQFVAQTDDFQGIVAFQSPVKSGRSVVALVADDPALLPMLIQNMGDQRFNSQIQGDLSIFNGDGMTSFAVGPSYWVGSLPVWMKIIYWFSDKPIILAISCILIAFVLTGPVFLLLNRRARGRLSADKES